MKSIGAKTIVYPTPVFIVGTYDAKGVPNGMAVAWGGICCSDPPCIAVSLREATYTYGNIRKRKAFTVSVPSGKYVKEADYFGIVSGRSVNKFEATGLTPVRSELVDAPYVGEFPLVLECSLLKTVKIGLHTQFIGKMEDVKAGDVIVGEDGMPDIEKAAPLLFAPDSCGYWKTGAFAAKAFSIGKKIEGH